MAATLSPRAHRWFKALHEVLAGVLIGSTAAMLILLLLRTTLPSGRDPFPFDFALYLLFSYPVTWSFYALLLTGLTFSLFTNWGFARYRWVLLKWLGFTLLLAAAWFGLGPAVHGLVGLSDGGLATPELRRAHEAFAGAGTGWLAAFAALLATMVALSVLKPFGRTSLRRAPPRGVVLAVTALLMLGLGGMGAMQARTLARYRALPIAEPDFSVLPDGACIGRAAFGGFTYRVEVRLRDGRIGQVRALDNRDNIFARVAEGVLRRIVEQQRVGVDAITGATTTSRALQAATADALGRKGR